MHDRLTELELWRRALSRSSGREVWRGVRDLARSLPEPSPEFPAGADRAPAFELGRRDFFKLVGAGAALAGLSGCPERPVESIVPFGEQAPELRPGLPVSYATSMVIDGFATGLLAQSHAGRPVKLEGNPDHPASLGATGVHHQASILELYDPSRARDLLRRGRPATWNALVDAVAGAGPRPWFVLYPQSSAVVGSLVRRIRLRFPEARFCFHSPVERRAVYAAARAAFGRPLDCLYAFRAADRVLALDADFASAMPNSVRWARDFAARRRLSSPGDDPGRLYVVEPAPSPTGSLADHRLAVAGSEVTAVAAAVLIELVSLAGGGLPEAVVGAARQLAGGRHGPFARAVARDLARSPGASLALAGERQPEATHVLAHAINHVLGSFGRTVSLIEPALLDPMGGESLAQLARELRARTADTVVVLEANPAYTAFADLELAALLPRARRSLHLSLFYNETSRACEWFVPAAHYLESWGEGRAYDGTVSLIQPLIQPLYGGKTVTEILALWTDFRPQGDSQGEGASPGGMTLDHMLLFDSARARGLAGEEWQRALQRGLIADSGAPAVPATLYLAGVAAVLDRAVRAARAAGPGAGLELCLDSDHAVYDGRFASNGWLQELPRPMTKLTWDNAALLSPRTAVALGVETESVVELALAGRTLRAPVVVLPGHADGAVTLALGYGRGGDEAVARGVGVNAFALRTSRAGAFAPGLEIRPTGETYGLAFTQDHWQLHGREIALHADLAHYREHPDFTAAHRGPQPSWLPQVFDYSRGEQWAMTIDTMICSGCSGCVVACQAENNIPVVGKEGVARSREMHWLRIDRYFTGPADDPTILNQPMLCQHCEKAPCEYVCPVFATTHSPDGLNEMVYNRCIGTRFCSNNCPYKVRRFNWFDWFGGDRGAGSGPGSGADSIIALQRNPDVTVRSRGVMEKCTYCVQRIRRSGIDARIHGRELEPGEVQTACQQACPTGAIQFGSLHHEGTEMVAWRAQPRQYNVLHELGTRPRTTYLARIRNPNPEMP